MSFDRVSFWLERMWRYKNITKNLEGYTVRRVGDIVEVRSNDKEKLYDLIVGKDFVRLEFIVSLSKIKEFFNEVATLNYYFEGALSPLLWKLSDCDKNGDCKPGKQGLVRGLYHIINTGDGMIVGTDFIVKGINGQMRYSEVVPLKFRFRGVRSLDRFKPEKKEKGGLRSLIERLKRVLGNTRPLRRAPRRSC